MDSRSGPATQHVPIVKKEAGILGGFFGNLRTSPDSGDALKAGQKDSKKIKIAGKSPDFGEWQLPSPSLLQQVVHRATVTPAEIREKSAEIERTLLQFKIGVEMRGEKV